MSPMTTQEYIAQKMTLLKECLAISEEFMSRIEDWEALEGILDRRQSVIQQLEDLDAAVDPTVAQSRTGEEQAQADQMIKLILGLDQDALKNLQQEKGEIMSTLKSNVQGQKISGYASEAGQRGRFLDFKE